MGLKDLRTKKSNNLPVATSQPEYKTALWDKVRDCIGRDCSLFDGCPFRATINNRLNRYVNPKDYICPYEYTKLKDNMGYKFDVQVHLVDPLSQTPQVYVWNGKTYLQRRKANQMNTLGPCLVEQHYMDSISQPLVRLMEEANDPFINQIIGYHLVPRYLDLLHLKIERLANARDVLLYGPRGGGGGKINPLFREIRATSESILRLWQTSGLEEVARKCGFFHIGGKIIPDDDLEFDFEADGDPGEYERMAGGE